jgi:hypothetical protein
VGFELSLLASNRLVIKCSNYGEVLYLTRICFCYTVQYRTKREQWVAKMTSTPPRPLSERTREDGPSSTMRIAFYCDEYGQSWWPG